FPIAAPRLRLMLARPCQGIEPALDRAKTRRPRVGAVLRPSVHRRPRHPPAHPAQPHLTCEGARASEPAKKSLSGCRSIPLSPATTGERARVRGCLSATDVNPYTPFH